MSEARQLTTAELEQGLPYIEASPKDNGELKLIVYRPDVDQRHSVDEGLLDEEHGLVGDNWLTRGSRHMPDGAADPEMQLNIMNSRVAELVADGTARMSLAGDQLYLDLDLSSANLPPGTRLQLGEAVLEVTEQPHTGCKKFAARFGSDAVIFVNSGYGRTQNFRGICARVAKGGAIRVGDTAKKIS